MLLPLLDVHDDHVVRPSERYQMIPYCVEVVDWDPGNKVYSPILTQILITWNYIRRARMAGMVTRSPQDQHIHPEPPWA